MFSADPTSDQLRRLVDQRLLVGLGVVGLSRVGLWWLGVGGCGAGRLALVLSDSDPIEATGQFGGRPLRKTHFG